MHLRSCLLKLTLCNSRYRSWECVAFLKGVVLVLGWWEKLEADPKARPNLALDEHLHHQQKTHPLWPGLLSAVVKQATASLGEKIQFE